MRLRPLLLVLALGCATSAPPPTTPPGDPRLAPNAPQDRPVSTKGAEEAAELERRMQPYVDQARASWPGARAKFLEGLPAGHTFFVTVRLREGANYEQVFLAVDRIERGAVTGRIWNDLNVMRTYRLRQVVTVPEAELLDWLISKPDGSEEGNFVGKFLDTLHQPAP